MTDQQITNSAGAPAALVERFYEAMNTGNPALVDDVATNVLAPDWVNDPAAPGQLSGGAGFRAFVSWFRSVWPDFQITHEDVVVSADGHKVAVRSTSRATHVNEFQGLPATGKQLAYRAFDFHQVEDGRIVHSWHLEDVLGLLTQAGATVGPAS